MNVFVVTSNYISNNVFGTYSTIKRARIAFENFLSNNGNIIAFEDIGNYCYQFTTKNGETFGAEIFWDYLDAEFEEGIIKEN